MADNKIKNILAFSIVLTASIVFYSCSAGKSASEYQSLLTNDAVKSRSTEMKVKIPAGWFSAVDNENNLIDLWLIKEDHSAVLSFMAINPDETAIKEAGGDPVAAAVKYSKAFRKTSPGNRIEPVGDDEIFDIGSGSFTAYKYKNKTGALVRVVLFKYKGKIFEFTASPSPSSDLKPSLSEELFLTQNAVLSSIE